MPAAKGMEVDHDLFINPSPSTFNRSWLDCYLMAVLEEEALKTCCTMLGDLRMHWLQNNSLGSLL